MLEQERDNPFQPEGEVCQDAELILQLWKGGRLGAPDSLAADLARAASQDTGPQHGNSHDLGDHLTGQACENNLTVNHGEDDLTLKAGEGNLNIDYVEGGGGRQGRGQELVQTTQLALLSDKQKHKNKLKKHCNMM